MEEKKTPEIQKVKPNRKPLFIIGLVFGILLGAVLTMLVVDWLHYRLPKTVQVNSDATRREAVSDTVVNYVIHKYERDYGVKQADRYGEVTEEDSVYLEDESEDLMMDEEELEEINEMEHQVQRSQMLWKENVWVVYLNDEKEERTGESVMCIQVKGWDTPIKNKMSYWFTDNTLNLRGINKESLKIYHSRDSFYLVVNHKVYPFHHNKQFEKMVETKDVKF